MTINAKTYVTEALPIPQPQTLVCVGIASAEAFGALTVSLPIAPVGIASAEAFGVPVVSEGTPIVIQPASLVAVDLFGSASLTVGPASLIIQPLGIASAEAFGTVNITGGGNQVFSSYSDFLGWTNVDYLANFTLTSFAWAVAEGGSGSGVLSLTIQPTGVGSDEAFGNASITNFAIQPTGIASGEAFGSVTVATAAFEPGYLEYFAWSGVDQLTGATRTQFVALNYAA